MITNFIISYVFHYTPEPEEPDEEPEEVSIDGHSVVEFQGRLDAESARKVISELEEQIATTNSLDPLACRLVATNVSILSVDYGSDGSKEP